MDNIDIDFEALLPFQIFAILACFYRDVMAFPSAAVALLVIYGMSQFMILTRTFDRPKGHRKNYFLSNEAYSFVTVSFILLIGSAMHRFVV